MGFKKPFRAEPVVLGDYQVRQTARKRRRATAKILACAAGGGLVIGAATAGFEGQNTSGLATSIRQTYSKTGVVGRNAPPPGAYYSGCDDARAAGVAPLYFSDPGYRPEMDGDGDGIACEPHRGSQNW